MAANETVRINPADIQRLVTELQTHGRIIEQAVQNMGNQIANTNWHSNVANQWLQAWGSSLVPAVNRLTKDIHTGAASASKWAATTRQVGS